MAVTDTPVDLALLAVDLADDQLAALVADLDDEQFQAFTAALDSPEVVGYAAGARYVDDPVGWVSNVLGEYLWSAQRAICESVRDNRQTAVPSCHGPGKSYTAARIVAWWLGSHRPGDAFAITTAPTGDQVRGILWKEIGRAHAKGKLPGRVNLSQWYMSSGGHDEMVAMGRKPSDSNPAAFTGHHARFILVVIDEADGVAGPLWESARALATNNAARILAIGNPDRGTGEFFKVCQPGSGWNVIRISAFETPNFTGEKVPEPLPDLLVDHVYVNDLRDRLGEDHPIYQSKVLARAPADNPQGVVPASGLMDCIEHDPEQLTLIDSSDECEVGIDLGAGGDLTVAWARHGMRLGERWQEAGNDGMKTAEGAAAFIAQVGAKKVKVDVIGIGYGIHARLRQLSQDPTSAIHGVQVIGVNWGTRSSKPARFPKLRDQVWWEVGHDLTVNRHWNLGVLAGPNGRGLSPLGEKVHMELTAPQWSPSAGGLIQVEPKSDTIRRIGHSPDDADAILLAFYTPVTTGRAFGTQVAQRQLRVGSARAVG